ncbi:MAG: sulfhydrogenase 1 subunit delta [Candidatus Heimdallarchaeum aukensis]|uniref:Sulfhydrogenase 1 subunit delta n=1 Tax=Candidatus Heimdallarchaeum aukensis TaxID=2876573 RepID=A0A9Y1BNJ4_9ARCH|nr:MAG: sulfhydrogenase 1 subunit delta [Candidatus Heimdallarchaeum aukensis]
MKTTIIPEDQKIEIKEETKRKPTIGVYALTSCYGCQLKIATVSKILEIAESVDIESFYMLSSDSSIHKKVDIAFVEGSVSTKKDLEELLEIRKNSKTLVGVGACALQGGVQSWSNGIKSYDELFENVYGKNKIEISEAIEAKPIEEYVEVDFRLPGCPPEEEEIIYFISTFLFGSWPEEKDYPVCQECRFAGNICLLIEKNEPCLGSITTAGCNARCISYNVPCIGCRGPVPNDVAWFDSLAKVFVEKGFTEEYIRERMKIFGSHHPKLEELLAKVFGGEKK